jgi:hypothetical protein
MSRDVGRWVPRARIADEPGRGRRVHVTRFHPGRAAQAARFLEPTFNLKSIAPTLHRSPLSFSIAYHEHLLA